MFPGTIPLQHMDSFRFPPAVIWTLHLLSSAKFRSGGTPWDPSPGVLACQIRIPFTAPFYAQLPGRGPLLIPCITTAFSAMSLAHIFEHVFRTDHSSKFKSPATSTVRATFSAPPPPMKAAWGIHIAGLVDGLAS